MRRRAVCSASGLWFRLPWFPVTVSTRWWRRIDLADLVPSGKAGLRRSARKSTFDSGARSSVNQIQAPEVRRSSHSSGKGEDQYHVHQRKNHQAVSERQMHKQPELQGRLQSVMIIQAIFLANEV